MNAVVGLPVVQRQGQFIHQRLVERIQCIRTVQRDQADRAFLFDQDVLIGH